ncbi:MAG: N-acylglucosamine 2-epimerase, partial [Candidatus Glassbacteria bacterium]|nr:N-acylglucosamine 2-epimerase [Candidatus Glassbacteria bacterium]
TGENRLAAEALLMFDKVVELADNPRLLGRPMLEGRPEVSAMSVPMMLLCAAEQFSRGRDDFPHAERMEGWVAEVMIHADPGRKLVLENVAPDGSHLPGSEGRLMNPGHAIEAGWFVLEYLEARGIEEHRQRALEMIEWSFERGWDNAHGGIYYFLDSENRPPLQLEWQMKLWWPLCEALYGTLLAWSLSGNDKYAGYFERTWDYIADRLIDREHGEWFGYLDRQGAPTHQLKGGPYKCFFHVPRTLMFCIKLLERIEG